MKKFLRKYILKFSRFSVIYSVVFILCCGHIAILTFSSNLFHENDSKNSLYGMMSGQGYKPFVYRSMLARKTYDFVGFLSINSQEKIFNLIQKNDLFFKESLHISSNLWNKKNISSHSRTTIAISYYFITLMILISMLLVLYFIYKLTLFFNFQFSKSLVFVMFFSFILPVLFYKFFYYYDFIELLGVYSCVYFFLKKNFFLTTILIFLFSFNKETFFLVPLALFFLHDDVALPQKIFIFVIQFILSFIGRKYIMDAYLSNPGYFVEYHFIHNLNFWLNIKSYFQFSSNGFPALQNPLFAIPFYVYFMESWKSVEQRYKRYFYFSFFPLLILYILFGYEDEFRVFILSLPAFTLIFLSNKRNINDEFFENKSDQKIQCL